MRSKLNWQDKLFLGELDNQYIGKCLKNYDLFLKKGYPKRKRITLGIPLIKKNKQIIGYSQITLLNYASPLKGELENMGLSEKLNYFHLKKFLIDQHYWGKGFSNELLKYSLDLADEFEKELICDVNSKNKNMIQLLERNGLFEDFQWEIKKDKKITLMSRMVR